MRRFVFCAVALLIAVRFDAADLGAQDTAQFRFRVGPTARTLQGRIERHTADSVFLRTTPTSPLIGVVRSDINGVERQYTVKGPSELPPCLVMGTLLGALFYGLDRWYNSDLRPSRGSLYKGGALGCFLGAVIGGKVPPPEWRLAQLPVFDSITSARAEPRAPAYTAYLTPDPDAVPVSARQPVAPFVRAGTSLTWYGHRTRWDSLTAQLALTLPARDSVTLELTVRSDRKSETRRATPIGTGAEQRVAFGNFVGQDTGYLQFELRLRDKRATSKIVVNALLLSGPGAAGAHFNMDARRNAASVHLRYPTDSTALVTGFYTEVTAIDDPVQTYYMATGFSRGYFGMQVNSATERRIIFSVWDAANGTSAIDRSTVAAENHTQLVAKGDGVVAEVFGNEGTGGHSHLVYPWKTREPQKFFVTAAVDGSATVYSGYWYHPENRSWMLIASFRAAKDSLGLKRLYSFSENFGGSTGHLRRKARYGSQWIRLANGDWQELTTASFSHDPTGRVHRRDRFMGLEDGAFFLSHGGFRSGFTEAGTTFSRPAAGVPPRIVLPSR